MFVGDGSTVRKALAELSDVIAAETFVGFC